MPPATSPWWFLVAAIPFGMWWSGSLGGGAAKLLIALLPWFTPGQYVLVFFGGALALWASCLLPTW